MTITFDTDAPERTQVLPVTAARSRDLYFALSTDPAGCSGAALDYLRAQLDAARALPADLPERLDQLDGWIRERTVAVGESYREYLAARKAGSARRYFANKSQALYFLQGVAPTKLVDGAWLYSTLRNWDNPDYHDLIRTYLEELGDGVPDKNHVTLYRKLLAAHGCEDWRHLDDHHFVQGAIQLA
ncbi:MAG TPA: iron-containing redox enzyme family protein, partial [Telluria sp.]|nr:iron-containing redox enzyme family protein [Telluria sp.]